MRQLSGKPGQTALAVIATTLVCVAQASATGATKVFAGNLCSTVPASAVAALKIAGPCIKEKTLTRVQATPLGSVRTVIYNARWGNIGTISAPSPHIAVEVIYAQGSAAAVAYAQKFFRAKVISNGIPISTNPVASESADTAACHNPPIDDCTSGEILALVGQYGVTIGYQGPAKFVRPDDPTNVDQARDPANDTAQEEAIKAPFVAFAKSVMSAL